MALLIVSQLLLLLQWTGEAFTGKYQSIRHKGCNCGVRAFAQLSEGSSAKIEKQNMIDLEGMQLGHMVLY